MPPGYDSLSYSPPRSPDASPTFSRPSLSRSRSRRTSFAQGPLPQRLYALANNFAHQSLRAFHKLTLAQKSLVVLAVALSVAFGIILLIYGEEIFAWLVPVAEKWRQLPGGWAILWLMTVATAFPPVIGYSTCVTVAGFLYGFPHG